MSLVYTTLASDTFHRANENPVNPTVWSDFPPTNIPANQIVSDELEPAAVPGPSGDSVSIYYPITWPTNQWAQVQIDACDSPDFPNAYSSVLLVLNRGANQLNGYTFEVDGPLGANCNVSIFSSNNDVLTFYLGDETDDVIIPLFAGDSIRMEMFDGMISAYTIHNGVSTQVLAPIAFASTTFGPAPLQNGPVALDLFFNAGPSDVQLSNFSGGSITTGESVYSVPDCRDTSIWPNDAVDVQGTETYTVPAHPSRTTPVDSRAVGAPVDSRKTRPENSRTFPPFSK